MRLSPTWTRMGTKGDRNLTVHLTTYDAFVEDVRVQPPLLAIV